MTILTIAAFALGAFTVADAATVSGAAHGAQAVWISDGAAPPAAVVDVTNQNKSFNPPLIVIGVGSSVRFPNNDPFYHSIYSVSPADPFDIGYYGNGPGKVVPFPNAGIVDVHCHIHPSMHGVIIVADGPFEQPTNDRFSLAGVAAGTWVLHTWSSANGEQTQRVKVPSGSGTITLR